MHVFLSWAKVAIKIETNVKQNKEVIVFFISLFAFYNDPKLLNFLTNRDFLIANFQFITTFAI